MLGLLLIAMGDVIIKHVLAGCQLKVDLGNGDGASGLSVVSKLLTLFVPLLTVWMIQTMLATVMHGTVASTQLAVDWFLLIVSTVGYGTLLLWPMQRFRTQIQAHVDQETELYRGKRRAVDSEVRKFLFERSEMGGDYLKLRQVHEALKTAERKLLRAWTWPITVRRLSIAGLLGVLPLALSVVVAAVRWAA